MTRPGRHGWLYETQCVVGASLPQTTFPLGLPSRASREQQWELTSAGARKREYYAGRARTTHGAAGWRRLTYTQRFFFASVMQQRGVAQQVGYTVVRRALVQQVQWQQLVYKVMQRKVGWCKWLTAQTVVQQVGVQQLAYTVGQRNVVWCKWFTAQRVMLYPRGCGGSSTTWTWRNFSNAACQQSVTFHAGSAEGYSKLSEWLFASGTDTLRPRHGSSSYLCLGCCLPQPKRKAQRGRRSSRTGFGGSCGVNG